MIAAKGHLEKNYTPHQRWLSERIQAAIPDLEDEVRACAASDHILVINFEDDGRSGPVGAARINRSPRAKLAGMGDARFDEPAPVHSGEVGACWILVSQDGAKGHILVRLGQMPIGEGGAA